MARLVRDHGGRRARRNGAHKSGFVMDRRGFFQRVAATPAAAMAGTMRYSVELEAIFERINEAADQVAEGDDRNRAVLEVIGARVESDLESLITMAAIEMGLVQRSTVIELRPSEELKILVGLLA